MDKEYLFETGSEHGRSHMDVLQSMMDPHGMMFLDQIDLRPGQRCLDVGAGGGSISSWLAQRTGPTGTVVAVDLDVDHIAEPPGVQVLRHDINDGVPGQQPYDLIHARLLLMHLSRREEILKAFVDALAPGGWLVLADFTDRPCRVLAAPSQADKELFERMHHISHELVGRAVGMSFEWAHQIDGKMAEAGLTNIHGMEFSQTMTGGDNGCLNHRTLNVQAEVPLLKAGATEEELRRYRELLLDPRFRAWYYQTCYFRGQKPVS